MSDNPTGQAAPVEDDGGMWLDQFERDQVLADSDEGAALPRQLTAAEVCQQHIDAIEASYSIHAGDVVDELRSAVLSLLYLTRNTDNAGRDARAKVDAELERIRAAETLPPHAEGWVVLRQNGFGAWSVLSRRVYGSERLAGRQVLNESREVVVPWQGSQEATLVYRSAHGLLPKGRLP